MIALSDYLQFLLTRHDEVVVPGFGCFRKQRRAARFDETGVIFPPTATVGFFPEMTENDGLLVNAIVRHESCNHQQASKYIAESLSAWEKSASDGQPVLLGTWGTLLYSDGRWLFGETAEPLRMPDLYGLMPCTLPVREMQPVVLRSSNTNETNRTSESDNVYRFAIDKRLVKQAMTAAAVLLLWFCFSTPAGDFADRTDFAAIDFSELFSPSRVTTVSPCVPETPAEAAAPETPVAVSGNPEANDLRQPSALSRSLGGYAVIVGSLPSRSGALQEKERLEKNGLTDLTLLENGARVRLALQVYETQTEAEGALQRLRSMRPECSDAWILRLP